MEYINLLTLNAGFSSPAQSYAITAGDVRAMLFRNNDDLANDQLPQNKLITVLSPLCFPEDSSAAFCPRSSSQSRLPLSVSLAPFPEEHPDLCCTLSSLWECGATLESIHSPSKDKSRTVF